MTTIEKTYKGYTDGDWPGRVVVESRDGTVPLARHTRHSPDGHSWGYGGSGPAQLALDILWDLFGKEPEPRTYMAFKDAKIATIPQHAAWRMTDVEIRDWLTEAGL